MRSLISHAHIYPPIIESTGDGDNARRLAGHWPHAALLRPADHLPLQRARTRTNTNHHFLPGLDVHTKHTSGCYWGHKKSTSTQYLLFSDRSIDLLPVKSQIFLEERNQKASTMRLIYIIIIISSYGFIWACNLHAR